MRLLQLFIATLACAQTPDFPAFIDIARQPAFLAAAAAREIQVDAAGNVYLAGSRTFGEVEGALKIGPVGNGLGDIYVIKMDAGLERVLFATVIGGSALDAIDAFKVDAAGNVYVGGFTHSSDFPFTQNWFPSGGAAAGFVVKLKADGSLAYAGPLPKMTPFVLDVDMAGALYVGGDAVGTELPRTTPAEQSAHGFVLKLNPAGASVEFGVYVGSGTATRGLFVHPNGRIIFLADDTVGALNASTRVEFSVPVERNSRHLGMDRAGNLYSTGDSDGVRRVRRFNASGEPLGQSPVPGPGNIHSMRVTPEGSVLLEGTTYAPAFSTLNTTRACVSSSRLPNGSAGVFPTFGGDRFLVIFRPDGELALSSYLGPSFTATALSPDGRYLYAMASQEVYAQTVNPIDGSKGLGGQAWSGLLRLDLTRIPLARRVAPACLANAATYESSALSPGGLSTIYGSNLGPQTGESFAVRNGAVPTDLAGTRVTVNGTPAPILYAQDGQVNFVAPWSMRTDGLSEVCVLRGAETGCLDALTDIMSPAAFALWDATTRTLNKIVLNQDFSINSSSNPVQRGAYVTLYVTGTGLLGGPLVDGAITGLPLQRLAVGTLATIEGQRTPPGCDGMSGGPCSVDNIPMEVSYAGSAPGLVAAVTQINLRIPETVPLGSRPVAVRFSPRAQPVVATVVVGP